MTFFNIDTCTAELTRAAAMSMEYLAMSPDMSKAFTSSLLF